VIIAQDLTVVPAPGAGRSNFIKTGDKIGSAFES